MNANDAHQAALALADFGHTGGRPIPFTDIDMATDLTDVPRPRTIADRFQICAALEDLTSPTDHQRPTT